MNLKPQDEKKDDLWENAKKTDRAASYFAGMVDYIPEALIAIDNQFIAIGWNAAAERIYGWKAEEVLGKPLKDFLQTVYQDTSTEEAARVTRETGIWVDKVTQMRKDGTRIPVLSSVSVVKDEEGNQIGFIGINRDISEQKQAEEALRQSEQKFFILFEKSVFAASLSRLPEGNIVNVNEAFERAFGYTKQEVVGKTSLELGINPDSEGRARILTALKESGSARNQEVALRTRSGEVRIFSVNVDVIHIGDQEYILNTTQDITERKQAEKQLAQMKRLYATLSQVNQTIVRVQNHLDLYESICNVAVQFGEFSLAWVGLLDEASGEVRPMAANGLDVAQWPFQNVNIHEGDLKDGLTATAIRTSKVVTSEDVESDQRTQALHEQFLKYSYHSSAAVPFRLRGRTIGVVSLVSREAGLFKAEEEMRLLDEMSLDISFALDTMETEAERKQAEAALQQSEERYRRTLDNMLEGCQIIGFDWRYLYLNDTTVKQGRNTRNELLHRTMMEMYPGIENTEMFDVLRDCMENRVARQMENKFTYLDGTNSWFELSIQPVPEGIFILSIDITERKRAEESAIESERQMRALVTSLDDIVFELDEQGTILNIWTANESLLTQPKNQVIRRRLMEVLGEEKGRPFTETVKRVLASGSPESIEYPLKVIDGQRWFVARISPILTQNDSPRTASILIRDISGRKQVEKQVQLQLRRLSALSEIDRAISSSLDMRLSLDVLLSEVLSQLGVDAASVMLLNPASQVLDFIAGKGFRTPAIRQSHMRLGEGFAGQAGLERKVLHIPNLVGAGNQFKRTELLKDEKFVEYFGVPLIAKGTLKGVLEVFHRSSLDPDLEWGNYLGTLGGQAAIAIDSAQLFEGLQQSNMELITAYDATIAGWSHAMDLRDKETEGHTQRVTELTVRLAEKMGVSQQELVQIRRGALLHDMGKLGVPDHILHKPGPLTEEEWVIMRQHPTYAFNMLLPISYLQPALDIPYCHHEKWDGTGYPRKLSGEQIPLAARLFAVVDVWDALRSDRPYREKWTVERTREYILEQSGKHFDPRVVDIFLNMIDNDQSIVQWK